MLPHRRRFVTHLQEAISHPAPALGDGLLRRHRAGPSLRSEAPKVYQRPHRHVKIALSAPGHFERRINDPDDLRRDRKPIQSFVPVESRDLGIGQIRRHLPVDRFQPAVHLLLPRRQIHFVCGLHQADGVLRSHRRPEERCDRFRRRLRGPASRRCRETHDNGEKRNRWQGNECRKESRRHTPRL